MKVLEKCICGQTYIIWAVQESDIEGKSSISGKTGIHLSRVPQNPPRISTSLIETLRLVEYV